MGDNLVIPSPVDVSTSTASTPGATPSASVSTVLAMNVAKISIGETPSSTNLNKRKQPEDLSGVPAAKKYRNHLPADAKPVYLALKNFYKKMAQWEAHKRFSENCASTGQAPRSLKWMPPLPWSFSNPGLNTNWSRTIIQAQADLCSIVAKDCALKIKRCENDIKALTEELGGIVSACDLQEITAELNTGYTIAVDNKFAEKVLRRNKGSMRGPSKPTASKTSRTFNTLKKDAKRGPPRTKGYNNPNKGKKAQEKGKGPKKDNLEVVNKKIQDQLRKLKTTLAHFNMEF